MKYFNKSFICDYYVCHNKKSEFVYQSVKETEVFALQKDFLKDLFETYPDIGKKIKSDSYNRYKKMIREPLLSKREQDVEQLNNRNTYKSYQIVNKI